MSGLMSFLLGVSLLAFTAMAIYRLVKYKNWLTFSLQLITLVLCFWFLHAFFDFPAIAPAATGKGEQEQEVYLVIVLYLFMLLGMVAQYGFTRFEQPKKKRKQFDFGLFIAPVFASPIIFIPLFASLQNCDLNLTQLDVAKMMLFFVAFENGFFWKEFFDNRRREKEKNES